MSKRIYKVTSENEIFMVRASSRAQAVGYVAREMIKAEVASQEDLVDHVSKGAKIHDAGEATQESEGA